MIYIIQQLLQKNLINIHLNQIKKRKGIQKSLSILTGLQQIEAYKITNI